MSDQVTHDFGPGKRCWGHDYSVMRVEDAGQRLHASGWGPRMKVGDLMLLDNRGRETCYRIAEYQQVIDPNDMWFAVLEFAPRQDA